MYGVERQHEILQRARDTRRVTVAVLADEFGVSTETIRRDLAVLEQRGLVRRVHGGAVAVERLAFEPDVAARNHVMASEKERIAKAALDQVPADGSVFIEAGTTTGRLGEMLPFDRELSVVTNDVSLAFMLAPRRGLTVITTGGRVRAKTFAEVDDLALRSLANLSVDVAFLGTNGVSVSGGLTTPDSSEAAVKRAALQIGRRRVLLADHTKIGTVTLCRYGEVSDIDMLITDTGLPDSELESLQSRIGQIVRA